MSAAPGHMHGAGAMLHQQHARLDVLFEQLLEAYRGGDWDDVRVVWTRFDRALSAHMDYEERHLLPVLSRTSEGEAAALRAEHDEIRRMVASLGVCVDLHAVKDDVAADLIAKLREHAAREDHLAYRVADRELAAVDVVPLGPADAQPAGEAPNSAPTA